MKTDRKPLMIYIHVPFCIKKCSYCDFLSFGNDCCNEEDKRLYVEALCSEIINFKEKAADRTVVSVFIGGGTPSVLDADCIKNICSALHEAFEFGQDVEFTIECNPGTVSMDKLKTYRECGINRISFGLQSVRNEELKVLGRIHSYEDFLQSYGMARKAGFENINIDLMSAIPGQTVESWVENLKEVIALRPEHISAYSLIIEEGTPFYELYGDEEDIDSAALRLPDEDAERQMYYLTKKLLGENGYARYEISNYARPGFECRHNCGYWQGVEYAGFGLGAASLFNGQRYSDISDIKLYGQCNHFVDETTLHTLNENEKMEEFMFLGLRMDCGVSIHEFECRFGKGIDEVYEKVIEKLAAQELIILEGDRWKLTDLGIDVSNAVLSEFLLE